MTYYIKLGCTRQDRLFLPHKLGRELSIRIGLRNETVTTH
jgi:hypothetical protein